MNGHERKKMSPPGSRLEQALDTLEGRPRQVMDLWLEGKSHAEIANLLGMTERTARVLRAAATRQMRQCIAALPPPYGRDKE